MFHILLVSENKSTLRSLYYSIEDKSKYVIHALPFSIDAEESFFINHADLVILDTAVHIPFQNIINSFSRYQWDYRIILLTDDNKKILEDKRTYVFNKKDLTENTLKECILSILSSSIKEQETDFRITVNWEGPHPLTINQDTFHLIYIRNFNKKTILDENAIKQIEAKTSSYAKLNVITARPNEMLCYIARKDIKTHFSFDLLQKDMNFILGKRTVIIYCQSINSRNFQDECDNLHEASKLSYFLNGCCTDISNIKSQTHEEKLIHEECSELMFSILNNDNILSIHQLRNLYLNTLKKSCSFKVRDYIRIQINFLFSLLTQYSFNFDSQSLEDELDLILQSALFRENIYSSAKLKEILINCVLKIYGSFNTDKSLEGIALEMDRNKIYLNRIYKEHFDITILDTIQILKIEHAKY